MKSSKSKPDVKSKVKKIAVIGAGMAGVTCARTLAQAGHQVTIFEKNQTIGGRMARRNSPFGAFDTGAQYFTVRDPRFERALQTVPGLCKPWSANTVRVLDAQGRVTESDLPPQEAHWVPAPTMDALPRHWAAPLIATDSVVFETLITRIERDAVHANVALVAVVDAHPEAPATFAAAEALFHTNPVHKPMARRVAGNHTIGEHCS